MLLHLLIVILVVGLLLWAVNALIPMQPQVKQIFNIVAIVGLLIYILTMLL